MRSMADLLAYSYSPAAWVEVSGEDAFAFLQGQFSNNLDSSVANAATYGLWLNAKGGLEGDSLVLRGEGNRFILYSGITPASALQERLETFVFSDDVIVDDHTDQVKALTLWGTGARDLIEALGWQVPQPGTYTRPENWIWIVPAWWSANGAFEVVVLSDRWESISHLVKDRLAAGAGKWAGESDFHFERIGSGMPAAMLDVACGALPQEGGLERIAVSYEKGCYTGQEVMARLRHKGRLRRGLVTARLEEPAERIPCPVYHNGKEAGRITSLGERDGERLAFVLVDRSVAEQAEGLSLRPDGKACIRILGRQNPRP